MQVLSSRLFPVPDQVSNKYIAVVSASDPTSTPLRAQSQCQAGNMEPERGTHRPDDGCFDSFENIAMHIDQFEALQNAERHAQNSDFSHHDPTSQMHFASSPNAADHARVPCADNSPSPSPSPCHDEKPLTVSLEGAALCEAMQYAYENNLTSDYLLNSFSISHLFGKLVQSTIPVTNHDGFTDNSHLSTLEIPDPVLTDKTSTLTITPSSLRLVAEARYVLTEDEAQEVTEQVCRPIKTTPTKFELPILRTDNDRDLKAFQKHVMQNNSADTLLESIKKHRLPLYPQNIDEGEGMELSAKIRAESQARMKKADEERLSGTQASMTYLYSHTRDEYTAKDRMAYMIGEIKVEQASARRPRIGDKHTYSDNVRRRHQSRKRSRHQPAQSSSKSTLGLCRLRSTLAIYQSLQTIQARYSVTTSTP